MTMRQAPTDAELATRTEQHQAERARRVNALSLLDNVTRGGKSLHQVKRADLARIAVAFGMTVSSTTTKTAMVNHIEAAA